MGVARLAVLVSGTGTNLAALLAAIDEDEGFGAEVVVVLSDRPQVQALERAHHAGIDSIVVDWSEFATRHEFTEAICDALEPYRIDLVVLAGFMRILAPVAIDRYPNRIVNTHPALLPAFPGGRALEDALEHRVKVTGVTVHFVDEQVDHGPIIAQAAVPVVDGDTVATLRERIQEVEHRLYPATIKQVASSLPTNVERSVVSE